MIVIKIIGPTPPCAKCKRAEAEARKAAERFEGQVQVTKLDALSAEADRYGLLVTPATVLNDRVIASGRILPAEQIAAQIQAVLGG